MALPKQVEEQLKQLEEIEKQLEAAKTPKDQPPKEASEGDTQAQAEQDTQTVAEVPPVEAKPDTSAEPAVPEDTWQQKYKTLKGMYDAEVPRLHAQVKELTAQMNRLQSAVEKPTPKEPDKPTKLVTDADVQTFGEDLIEVQRKVAREVAMEFRSEIDALKADNDKLREQLQSTGSKMVEASFEQKLHRLVPDFDAVNVDPKWVEWLNEYDPILRGPRKLVAQDAFNRGDADAVADYVVMFKKSIAPVEPPKSKVEELSKQVQPRRTGSGTGQPAPQGKTYSSRDIERLFKQAADFGAKGKLDEARKLEAEIDAAYMDGRVTA
jgi:hypothetical protein